MFKPNYILNSVTDITVEFLDKNNIKALLLDVDNTLSVAHANKTLRNGVAQWLSDMREADIPMMILSNAKKKRAIRFADSVGLDVVGLAAKPLPFGYFRAVKKLKIKRKNVAIVGDQIFTDVMGGNLSGVKTILVTDITPEDKPFFKFKRKLEKKMLKRWKYER